MDSSSIAEEILFEIKEQPTPATQESQEELWDNLIEVLSYSLTKEQMSSLDIACAKKCFLLTRNK